MCEKTKRTLLWTLALLMGAAGASGLSLTPAVASVADPQVMIHEVHAFRHVFSLNDLLVIARFELPEADWQSTELPDDWMADATCDDASDIEDRCYTSIISGAATYVLKDEDGGIVNSVNVARVGHGLTAVYLCAVGDGNCQGQTADVITWADSVTTSCIRGPSTVSPRAEACAEPQWHSTSAVADTPAQLLTFLVPMVDQVEEDGNYRKNRLVSAGLITEEGAVFALEAFPAMTVAVPAAFQRSVLEIATSFNPVAASTPIATLKDVSTEPIATAFDSFATDFGTTRNVVGTLFMSLLAVFVLIFVVRSTGGNFAVGTALGFLVLLTGAFVGIVMWAAVFVLALLVVIMGSAWWFRSQQPG